MIIFSSQNVLFAFQSKHWEQFVTGHRSKLQYAINCASVTHFHTQKTNVIDVSQTWYENA